MKTNEIISERGILPYNKQQDTNIQAFIFEILAAEQRILKKQNELAGQKTAINLYKESILIRELFACVSRYFDLTLHLSSEQYAAVKRVWCKAFKTSLSASQDIDNKSSVKSIELNMVHAIMKIKVPCEHPESGLLPH